MNKNQIYVLMGTNSKTGSPVIKGTTFSTRNANHFLNEDSTKDSRWVELWEINNNMIRENSKELQIWIMGEEVKES